MHISRPASSKPARRPSTSNAARRPSSSNGSRRPSSSYTGMDSVMRVPHTQDLTISIADLTDKRSSVAKRNQESAINSFRSAASGQSMDMSFRRDEAGDGKRASSAQGASMPQSILVSPGEPKLRRLGSKEKVRIEGEAPGKSWEKPRGRNENGWQMRHTKVMDRMSSLFNSWTMSDVIFQIGNRQIPAHKFVLGTASPVLYNELYSLQHGFPGSYGSKVRRMSCFDVYNCPTNGDATPGDLSVGSGGGGSSSELPGPRRFDSSSHLRLIIQDYSIDAVYEFLRFVYTDDVEISLEIVVELVFMADELKVTPLGERCFDFLRAKINGENVLTILEILRTLMKKGVICLWKELVERTKVLNQFRGMSSVERKHKMHAIIAVTSAIQSELRTAPTSAAHSRTGSRVGSRAASRMTSRAASRVGSRKGSLDTEGSEKSFYNDSEVTGGTHNVDKSAADIDMDMQDLGDDEIAYKLMGGKDLGALKRSHQLYQQLANMSEDLNAKCWKCVSDDIDIVLTCDTWLDQPLNVVKNVLRLDACSVPEIALFRAVLQWIDHRCHATGLPALPENRKKVLGDALELIRFPLMTCTEIQWEVVPTGLLDFKDLDALLHTGSRKNMGRFSAEPRHFPLTKFFQIEGQQNWMEGKTSRAGSRKNSGSVPVDRAGLMEKYLETYKVLARETFNVEDHDRKLAPKMVTYASHDDDELDAMVGMQLLRGHVNRFVDNFTNDLATADADVRWGKSRDYKVIPALDPGDFKTMSTDGGSNSRKEQVSMLMYRPSWLQNELAEERAREAVEGMATQGTQIDLNKFSVPAQGNTVKCTNWGCVPEPQDFDRLAKGYYSFREERILQMKLDNGEPVVYEHTLDEASDTLFGHDLNDLRLCRNAEEVQRCLYCSENDEPPSEKVSLEVFMCRQ